MTKEQVYRKASDMWGAPAQLNVAMEECAELIVAISKAIRTGQPSDNLAEEMADVEIMLEQIKEIYPQIVDNIAVYKKMKIERLGRKLNEA